MWYECTNKKRVAIALVLYSQFAVISVTSTPTYLTTSFFGWNIDTSSAVGVLYTLIVVPLGDLRLHSANTSNGDSTFAPTGELAYPMENLVSINAGKSWTVQVM